MVRIADPRARMGEDAGLRRRFQDSHLRPQPRLRHRSDQDAPHEIRVPLDQPGLAEEEVVQVRADRRRMTGLARRERLQAVERLRHDAGVLRLEEVEQDRVAVREEPFLVVRGLLDRDAEEIGVLRQLLLDPRLEVDRALPARPAGPRRDPPLGALVERRGFDDLHRVLGRRRRRSGHHLLPHGGRRRGRRDRRGGRRRGWCGRRDGRRRRRRGRRDGRGQGRRGRLKRSRDDGPHGLFEHPRRRGRPLRRPRGNGSTGHELAARGRHRERPTEQFHDAVLEHGEFLVVELLASLDQREQRGEGGRALHDRRRALRRGPRRVEHRRADLSRLRLTVEQRGEVRIVHVVDGHNAVQNGEDAPTGLGRGRALGLARDRLRHRRDHALERAEADELGLRGRRDSEGARRVEDARAQVHELAARGGELFADRLGGERARPLEFLRRPGELRRQSCEPLGQRGEVLDEIVRLRRHGMVQILGACHGRVKPGRERAGGRGRYSDVTRSTSSTVVTPWSTFSRPASRSVFMPCFAATSLISLAKVLLRMRPRISDVTASTS